MNQEESEHNEVDGMKKGVDSKGEVMHIQRRILTIFICILIFFVAFCQRFIYEYMDMDMYKSFVKNKLSLLQIKKQKRVCAPRISQSHFWRLYLDAVT